MKTLKQIAIFATALAFLAACDAIEDQTLRNEYHSATTPLTRELLTSALTVTQLPNAEGVVEGDQCIVVKNSKPEIGGQWILMKDGVVAAKSACDVDTLYATSNGIFQLYYQGISDNTIVISHVFDLTVTNFFDEFDRYLSGAKDKADVNAKKIWKFRRVVSGSWIGYADNGAHGAWKYTNAGYTPETIANVSWWGFVGDAGGAHVDYPIGNHIKQRMTFTYKDNKINITNDDGSPRREGTFKYNHDEVETGVKGLLTTSIPLMGSEYWNECSDGLVWYILTLDDKYMTLYNTSAEPGKGADWEDCGWYVFYEATEE